MSWPLATIAIPCLNERDSIQSCVRSVLAQDYPPEQLEILVADGVLTEEQLILELLNRQGILVHPGYFFDFQREAFVVVSLLPPLDVFREAVPRLLRFAWRSAARRPSRAQACTRPRRT